MPKIEPKILLFVLVVLIVAAISVYAFFALQLQPSSEDILLDRSYEVRFEGATMKKHVFITREEHVEEISLRFDSPEKPVVLFTVVPKALAQSASDASIATNGSYEVLESDPVFYFTRKNIPEGIDLRMVFSTSGESYSTTNLVLPEALVNALTPEQVKEIAQKLLASSEIKLSTEEAKYYEEFLAEHISAVLRGLDKEELGEKQTQAVQDQLIAAIDESNTAALNKKKLILSVSVEPSVIYPELGMTAKIIVSPSQKTRANIEIHNPAGEKISVLASGSQLEPKSSIEFEWNAKDNEGNPLEAGEYVVMAFDSKGESIEIEDPLNSTIVVKKKPAAECLPRQALAEQCAWLSEKAGRRIDLSVRKQPPEKDNKFVFTRCWYYPDYNPPQGLELFPVEVPNVLLNLDGVEGGTVEASVKQFEEDPCEPHILTIELDFSEYFSRNQNPSKILRGTILFDYSKKLLFGKKLEFPIEISLLAENFSVQHSVEEFSEEGFNSSKESKQLRAFFEPEIEKEFPESIALGQTELLSHSVEEYFVERESGWYSEISRQLGAQGETIHMTETKESKSPVFSTQILQPNAILLDPSGETQTIMPVYLPEATYFGYIEKHYKANGEVKYDPDELVWEKQTIIYYTLPSYLYNQSLYLSNNKDGSISKTTYRDGKESYNISFYSFLEGISSSQGNQILDFDSTGKLLSAHISEIVIEPDETGFSSKKTVTVKEFGAGGYLSKISIEESRPANEPATYTKTGKSFSEDGRLVSVSTEKKYYKDSKTIQDYEIVFESFDNDTYSRQSAVSVDSFISESIPGTVKTVLEYFNSKAGAPIRREVSVTEHSKMYGNVLSISKQIFEQKNGILELVKKEEQHFDCSIIGINQIASCQMDSLRIFEEDDLYSSVPSSETITTVLERDLEGNVRKHSTQNFEKGVLQDTTVSESIEGGKNIVKFFAGEAFETGKELIPLWVNTQLWQQKSDSSGRVIAQKNVSYKGMPVMYFLEKNISPDHVKFYSEIATEFEQSYLLLESSQTKYDTYFYGTSKRSSTEQVSYSRLWDYQLIK